MQEEQRTDDEEGLGGGAESFEESVSKAWDAIEARNSGGETPQPETGEAAPEIEADPVVETPAQAGERARDEHGRFIKTKADAAPHPIQQQLEGEAPEPQQRPDLAPPASFDAKEQADYQKLPPETKAAVQRIMRSRDEKFMSSQREVNQRMQQVTHQEREYGDLHRAIAQYTPHWGNHGLTPSQAILELASFQHRLVTGSEEEATISAAQMLRSSPKVNVEKVIQILGGQLPAGFQRQPQQDENHRLTADQIRQIMREEREVEHISADLQSVIDETDQAGKPRYPGLRIPGFIELLKSRALEIRETAPDGPSYGAALKRAYNETAPQYGLPSVNGDIPNNSSQARHPQSNQQPRAQGGSISVRGRGSPPPRRLNGAEVPKTLEGQVALAWDMIERGESL